MTEELQHTPEHIAGVDHAHELLRRMGYHRDGEWFIHANRRGAEAIHVSTISTIVSAGQLVITQRPAAQEEWPGQSNIASPFNACQHKGYCLQIASLPAAHQATKEQ